MLSSKIQILDEKLINQIAAGEVVERPASVVKELVENSIDSGATQIEVHLEDAGKKLIRVRDNGCGMSTADAKLSVERHATSKIKNLSDLFKVKTLGFRGEALPSIASVSHLTLTTKEQNSPEAIRLVLEGGKWFQEEPTGAPQGTEVRVHDLFFNTPARLKFLKSDATEMGHAVSQVEQLALSHPHISFRLSSEAKELFFAPKTEDPWERVVSILGDQKSSYIYVEEAIQAAVSTFSLKAYVSLPRYIVATSKYCYIFVNGRPVVDRTILHALTSAYHSLIPQGQYPKAVLFLEVSGSEIDVNVHPAKREIRFKDSRAIHRFIEQAVRKNLETISFSNGRVLPPIDALHCPSSPSAAGAAMEPLHRRHPPMENEIDSHFSFYPPDYRSHAGKVADELHEPVFNTESFPYSKWTYIGQIRNSYILCESHDELLFIDQHAAHERLIFEKLTKKINNHQLELQYLLVPLSLELSPSDALSLTDFLSAFRDLGFEIEPFGGTTFLIKSVPRLFQNRVTIDFFRGLLEELKASPQIKGSVVLHKVLSTLACHSARTAHEKLERDEILSLLQSLDTLEQAPHCPHGRPFGFRLPISEIEKKFRR